MITLPSAIRLAVSDIAAAQGSLLGDEILLVEGASSTRRREITAGRVLAHRLMRKIGDAPFQVLQKSDGAPLWPTGLTGSIAHSPQHVAVAIARSSLVRSVGIDIEDGRNLGTAASDIATSEEIESAIAHPFAGNREGAARLIFSAKEALYKCQAPLTGNRHLDCLSVRLEFGAPGEITAKPVASLDRLTSATVDKISILFQQVQGVILAVAWTFGGKDSV